MNELVIQAIEQIKEIKQSMIKSGNDVAYIVYNIREELAERNACRDFAIEVGMSKASISKMVTAETLRLECGISHDVSYNTIYKVKDLLNTDDVETYCAVVYMLNALKSESEIRNSLCSPVGITDDTPDDTADDTADDTDSTPDVTSDDTADDTEETRSEIVSQIFDILDSYGIQKDDMKLLKMLIKGLR